MRMVKMFFCIALCLFALANFGNLPVEARETIIRPFYVENCTANVYLNYTDNKANCVVSIRGSSSVSKISGTIFLFDETEGTNVASWSVEHSGYVYSTSKTTTVRAGHKYTLSFAGTVYTENGSSETVSSSVTKNN